MTLNLGSGLRFRVDVGGLGGSPAVVRGYRVSKRDLEGRVSLSQTRTSPTETRDSWVVANAIREIASLTKV